MAKLFIDAGHSTADSGAVAGGHRENLLAIDIRDTLAQMLLGKSSYEVVLIDDNLNLAETISFISNRASADDLAVSIHFNANNNTNIKGVEAYYYKKSDIAECFTRNVCAVTGQVNRGARMDTETFVGALGFLRKLPCKSVLVECAYLTNSEEAQLLNSKEFRNKIATGIVNAIIEMDTRNKIFWLQQSLIKLLEQLISSLQGKLTIKNK